jgi:hypothetical protein
MSEEKHFEYTAENPVFITPKEVKILGVRNLLPIEITYDADGEEKKVVAGVDYNAKTISIPGIPQDTAEKITEQFFEFVYGSMDLPSDLFAEDRPTVTPVPKEEDIKW